MCEPVSIATALTLASSAMAAGGHVLDYMGQSDRASANAHNASVAYGNEIGALTIRQGQEQESTAAQNLSNQREADAIRARAQVSAGESGVTGLSVQALLNDITGQNVRRTDTLNRNLAMTTSQLQAEKQGSYSSMISRIAQVPKPSTAGLLINLGQDGLQGFDAYKAGTDPTWRASH